MGAAFIWWFFPETKGLSLEEMDVVFGSQGFAAADAERMREINREIGLEKISASEPLPEIMVEKKGAQHNELETESP